MSWLVYYYYNGMPKFIKKMLNVNIKIAQTMQNIWNLACEQALCSHGIWNFIVWKSSLLKK